MYNLFSFLERSTNNDSSQFLIKLRIIFAPLFLILEYIVYWWYWKKIIIPELLTSDVIVDFLDKNEFAYEKSRIKKIDLIESNEFFDRLNIDEARVVIKKEFVDTISELIKENISTNIEDLINLLVETEIKFITKNGEKYKSRIYTVTIQFCRQFWIDDLKKKTYWWLFSFVGLMSILLLAFFKFG